MRGPAEDSESGQILVLSLVFALVAVTLVLVGVAATAVHLDRKRLWNLADEAALAAAGALDEDAFFVADAGEVGVVPITDDSVQEAVLALVTRAPAGRLRDVRVVRAETPDGRTAVVELEARSRPPLVGILLDVVGTDGIAVGARSSARAQ